ncbi:MAG: antibiotic biosynthesis monooxygenase family protein [Chitinophagales bacterium]
MLVRIVKMVFREEEVNTFLALFNERKHLIGGFEGCSGVELLRDINNPNTFFTYSRWRDEASLENYRNSELFNGTWELTKKLFAGKPEAWSVESV